MPLFFYKMTTGLNTTFPLGWKIPAWEIAEKLSTPLLRRLKGSHDRKCRWPVWQTSGREREEVSKKTHGGGGVGGSYGLHKHVHFIPGDSKEETNYIFANMAGAFTGAGASIFININVSQWSEGASWDGPLWSHMHVHTTSSVHSRWLSWWKQSNWAPVAGWWGSLIIYFFLFNRLHWKLIRGSEWSQAREYWIEFTDTPSNEIYADERKVSGRCESTAADTSLRTR